MYSQDQLKTILSNEEQYKKTPFLYLIASYSRNKAIEWADKNFVFLNKKHTGSWCVYCFQYI